MSTGNRLLITAIAGLIACICLFGGAFFGSLYGPDRKPYQSITGEQSGDGDYNGPSNSLRDIAGVPDPIERAIANPKPETGEDHEIRDLAAQEAMAAWAFWMAIATGGALFISAVGIGLVFITYQESQRANQIAREIGQAQTRAYLTIERVECKHTEDGISFKATVGNSGNSPALAAQILIEIINDDGSITTLEPLEEHTVPAQGSTEFCECFWLYDTSMQRAAILITAIVGYADVFGRIVDTRDRFAKTMDSLSDDYRAMLPGRHVSSYLRARGRN